MPSHQVTCRRSARLPPSSVPELTRVPSSLVTCQRRTVRFRCGSPPVHPQARSTFPSWAPGPRSLPQPTQLHEQPLSFALPRVTHHVLSRKNATIGTDDATRTLCAVASPGFFHVCAIRYDPLLPSVFYRSLLPPLLLVPTFPLMLLTDRLQIVTSSSFLTRTWPVPPSTLSRTGSPQVFAPASANDQLSTCKPITTNDCHISDFLADVNDSTTGS